MLQYGELKVDILAIIIIGIVICSVVSSVCSIFKKHDKDMEA